MSNPEQANAMSEPDEKLLRLFAATRAPERGEEFLAGVAVRITRARLRRRIARIGAFAALVALAVAATPYVAEGSLALAGRLVNATPALGDALASPAGWTASAAFALWGFRRFRTLGR
jgi:hypothetical protein